MVSRALFHKNSGTYMKQECKHLEVFLKYNYLFHILVIGMVRPLLYAATLYLQLDCCLVSSIVSDRAYYTSAICLHCVNPVATQETVKLSIACF